MGVMGLNLALNMERNGYHVALWDRHPEAVDKLLQGEGAGKRLVPSHTAEEFVRSLRAPRKIMIMVKAGPPIDWTIEQFVPYLEPGDILIDGGNSWFEDTRRREAALREKGFRFVGSGVSGGEEGALMGPSLMPGGAREAYEEIRPIWEAIAAKTEDGACTTYCGPDGAGHFVKMVHNGIEYGDMQLIAEAYDILRRVGRLEAKRAGGHFRILEQGAARFLFDSNHFGDSQGPRPGNGQAACRFDIGQGWTEGHGQMDRAGGARSGSRHPDHQRRDRRALYLRSQRGARRGVSLNRRPEDRG